MRVLIAVAMLMMCGYEMQATVATQPPKKIASVTDGKASDDCKVLIPSTTAEPCHLKDWQPAKQEKAHPAPSSGAITTGTLPRCKDAKFGELCMTKDGWLQMNFPFDLPAKEWDGPDDDPRFINTRVLRHHVSCKDVAPDWKQRVLLDSADGKHHCYNFSLLEQKP